MFDLRLMFALQVEKRHKATIMFNTSLEVVFGVPKYAQALYNQITERWVHPRAHASVRACVFVCVRACERVRACVCICVCARAVKHKSYINKQQVQ